MIVDGTKLSNNETIRLLLRVKNMYLWQLADRLGVSEATMTRIMRQEISSQMFDKLRYLIETDPNDLSWVTPGAVVKHPKYGEGVVNFISEDTVGVEFADHSKTFAYPYVFEKLIMRKGEQNDRNHS